MQSKLICFFNAVPSVWYIWCDCIKQCVEQQNAVLNDDDINYITISISLKPDVAVLISPVSNVNVGENKE